MVTTPRLTYYDYMGTSDDEHYELIDGALIDVASRNIPHQICQANMFIRVYEFVKRRDLGNIFLARTDVVLSKHDVVQPDMLFISKARKHIIGELNIKGAPDLALEITSPETDLRDWVVKRELYGFHGVKEYWIADPVEKRISVLLTRNGAMEVHREYGIDDTLISPTLEGFSVALSDIFDDRFDAIP